MKSRALFTVLAFLAASEAGASSGSRITILPPAPHQAEAFSVRASGQSPTKPELTYPAGEPFELQQGHRVWLEGEYLISPVAYTREDFAERRTARMPVTEAGLVTLPGSFRADRPRAIWLLSLGPPFEGEVPRHELLRFRRVSDMGGGVLMPAGSVIAGLWDVRGRYFVGLSKPFMVVAGKSVEAPLMQPGAGRSSLVMQLERASRAFELDQISLSSTALLTATGEARAPDSKLSTRDRIYGFWYDLESGRAQLASNTREDILAPIEVDLLPARVERVEAQLDLRPALEVALALPVALRDDENDLLLRSLPDSAIVARANLPPGTWTHTFSDLVPGLILVELHTRSGVFKKEVELPIAGSEYVRLEPEVIVVTGTVFFGDEAHPSKLSFMTVDKSTMETQTDAEGAYQVASLTALRHVTVEPEGVEAAPWVDFLVPALSESTQLDVYIPDARFRIRVYDVESGAPVAEAQVTVRNSFEAAGDEHEKTIVQRATTDEDGVALLPPLRPGSAEIRASAPGFFRMREPLRREVGSEDRTFEIGLEPTGSMVAVHLALPNGLPAGGAELMLVDSLSTARPLLSETADEKGLAALSRAAHGQLLIRHPEAAFLIRDWQPTEAVEEERWTLPPAVSQPLSLAIKDLQGEAVRRAWLALWVDGRRLSGVALAWLTRSRPFADSNGFWTGSNLPQARLAVVACPIKNRSEGETGLYDALAAEISLPWPPVLEISTAVQSQ